MDTESAEGEGEHALPASIDHPAVATNKEEDRERIDYVVRGLDANGAGSTLLGASLTTAQAHRTAAKQHPRRIAIFGGSFDPIHNGHLSVARAADRRFNFDELHFIPASRPPHKLKQHLAPFPHRFAMVSLASTEHPHFVPSLAEAGEDFSGTQLHYSVDTVRYFRHVYHGDRLFFHDRSRCVSGHSHVEGIRNPAYPVRFHYRQSPGHPHGSAAPGDTAGLDGARR